MKKQYEAAVPVYTQARKVEEKKEEILDLYTLPLISKFRYFQFSGRADNSFLQGNFDLVDITGKIIVIKAIKIVPYYEAASQDLYLNDGATVSAELIPANCRINRIFDVYDYGCQFSLFINNSRVPIFPTEMNVIVPAADGNVPLDLDLDNIYYKYPEKVTNIQMQLDAQIFQVLNAPAIDQPLVKVFLQCYLI